MNYLNRWGISIKYYHLLLSCFLYLSLSILTGCQQDTSSEPSNDDMRVSVELGPDLIVNIGEYVNLTPSIKNLESRVISYLWVQTSGNQISLTAYNKSYINFTPLENDSLEFKVTVTDEQGIEYNDSIIITVVPENDKYSAELRWTAPTENNNGSELTNLAGYRIHYGRSTTDLSSLILVNEPQTTSYNINNLDPNNSYYFCVSAYNSVGLESECSDIVDIIL